MGVTVDIPDFVVITVLTKRSTDATALLSKIENAEHIEANAQKPHSLMPLIIERLAAHRSMIIHLLHSNPKIRTNIAREARSAGAASIVICIGEDEDVDQKAEKHAQVLHLSAEDIDVLKFTRSRMPSDLRDIHGGFDIIGDIHGCADELLELLIQLGHAEKQSDGAVELISHRQGRRVCLAGDLTDRGPKNLEALQIAHRLSTEFGAIIVLGNHDEKLRKWLHGRDIRIAAGLSITIAEFDDAEPDLRARYAAWLDTLQSHYVLDEGNLVVAHAGLIERFHMRTSKSSNAFALYGQKTEEVGDDGYPILHDWAAEYSGTATVVHGHVVTDEPRIKNNVVSIDTGCVFGGKLTAYRYPDGDFISVQAHARHFTGNRYRTLD